ncbi:glucose-6-phosphate 1-dehydrogenase [Mycena olivaceomarginata]|nr:glucose-6-phosphate 1-dehydrogenase [Mycena olivaceomarginata]KAJ7847640.1 glucose-6-phosphate 1-dehydrogenase [Mycena olivaceomarginata]
MSGSIPSMESSHDALKDNTIIVVLGASGDLAKKKTFPALFGLFRQGFLPRDVKIMDKAEYHKRATSYLKNPNDDPEITQAIEKFKSISTYVSGSYDEGEAFAALNAHLEEIESHYASKEANRLFYFALPPSVFVPVAKNLREQCYVATGINRVIVEKPFGKDTASAAELLKSLKEYWTEDETFRIDHYLGKEMVKNLLVLRFANIALGAAWDKNYISKQGRGGYFDEFGMIHLLQVLSILTMERPVSFSAEDIRDEKVKVLRAIPPVAKEDTLLGQYVAANGKPGYLDDDTVPPGSFAPRVPFILKAGKALNEAKVEVRIQFKDVTQGIFKDIARNELVIRIQPSEAVYMKINAKTPGLYTRAMPTEMDLTYKRRFSDAKIPEAYEALILDALKGDHSNFVRHDELDVAWKIFTPILHWIEGKSGQRPRPVPYPYGSRGPKELDPFIQKYGFKRADASYVWPVTNLASL